MLQLILLTSKIFRSLKGEYNQALLKLNNLLLINSNKTLTNPLFNIFKKLPPVHAVVYDLVLGFNMYVLKKYSITFLLHSEHDNLTLHS